MNSAGQRKSIIFFAILTLLLGLGVFWAYFSLIQSPSQPLPTLQAKLEPGQHYWVSAVFASNAIFVYAEVYDRPQSALSGKLVGRFRDAMPVLLLDRQENQWCQVEGIGETGIYLEGWMACRQLLSYRPTPVPVSP